MINPYTTIEQARAAVLEKIKPDWALPDRLVISSTYLEDDEHYLLTWGSEKWLRDGDSSRMTIENTLTFVDKLLGIVTIELRSPELELKISRMQARQYVAS